MQSNMVIDRELFEQKDEISTRSSAVNRRSLNRRMIEARNSGRREFLKSYNKVAKLKKSMGR